jgi:hypothetical protein
MLAYGGHSLWKFAPKLVYRAIPPELKGYALELKRYVLEFKCYTRKFDGFTPGLSEILCAHRYNRPPYFSTPFFGFLTGY